MSDRYEAALRTPSEVYDHPRDLLADDTLSDAQKREILRHWEAEAAHLQESEGEGMEGGERSLLSEISRALHELEQR